MKSQYIMEKGCLVVYVPRELDHHQANRIRTETDLLIDTYHVRHLVFDLQRQSYGQLRDWVIIGRCKNLGYSGGDVSACHLNERVDKIFTVSGLKKIIQVKEIGDSGGSKNEQSERDETDI